MTQISVGTIILEYEAFGAPEAPVVLLIYAFRDATVSLANPFLSNAC